MARKIEPVITHTEILARAIRSIQADIEEFQQKAEKISPDADEKLAENLKGLAEYATASLRPKLDALKEMYRIETGTDYE